MGRNCQFQNSAVTRCAQNSKICKTLPLFQSWVESVNLHKLQGPEMHNLQFSAKNSPFSNLGENCQKFKVSGTIFVNSALVHQTYEDMLQNCEASNNFRSWAKSVKHTKHALIFEVSHIRRFRGCFRNFVFCSILSKHEAYEDSLMNSKSLRMNFQNTPFENSVIFFQFTNIRRVSLSLSSS